MNLPTKRKTWWSERVGEPDLELCPFGPMQIVSETSVGTLRRVKERLLSPQTTPTFDLVTEFVQCSLTKSDFLQLVAHLTSPHDTIPSENG